MEILDNISNDVCRTTKWQFQVPCEPFLVRQKSYVRLQQSTWQPRSSQGRASSRILVCAPPTAARAVLSQLDLSLEFGPLVHDSDSRNCRDDIPCVSRA